MDLLLSDIHLGSPLFKLEKQLISLLSDKKYERVFIIGDLIDEWEMDVGEILDKYKDVIDCINDSKKFIMIIKGNHDPSIDVLKAIFPGRAVYINYVINFGDKKTILTHGHEFNFMITKTLSLTKLLFPFQLLSERLGFNLNGALRDLYQSVASKIHHKKYNDLVFSMEKKAAEKYSEYDVIVMGHTHKEKLVKLPDNKFYVNTGSLVHYPVYTEFSNNYFVTKLIKGVNYDEYTV